MNKAVANLLNRVLRDWVEDLNPEQLNLSIFSGKILLRNLKLKSDFLDILGLPFKLESGTVGQIEVKIPWKNWYSSSLDVKVKDLSVLLKPVQVKDWSEEKEIEAIIKRKKFVLDHFEVMNPDDFDMNVEVGGNGILGSRLLGNLQISLENVYFRYEDTFFSSEDFALGGFIQKIDLVNCNSFWEKDNNNGDILYKLLLIENISFFVDYREGIVICKDWYDGTAQESLAQLMNEEKSQLIGHKYFLDPTSLRVELTINKDPGLVIPPFSVNIRGDKLKIEANVEQAEFIFSIKKFVTEHFLFKKNVEEKIPERNFENIEIQEYRKLYMDYRVACKSGETLLEEREEIRGKLIEFEKGIFLDEIKIQRKLVLDELKVLKFENEKKIELKQISSAANQNKLTKNLYKFIIRKSDSAEDLEEIDHLSKLKTMEMELARLESRDSSMIRQITRTRTEKLQFLKDSSQFFISFSFSSVSAHLYDDCKDYLSSIVKEIKVEVIIRLASIKINVKVGKLWINNTFNKDKDLFSGGLEVEYDDLDKKSAKICGKDWEMAFDYVYFSEFVKIVQKFIIVNLKTEESLDSISESSLKTEENEEFFNIFKDILENGIIISYFLQVDIKNFTLILPVNPKNSENNFFLCRFTEFNIKTNPKLKGLMTYDVYNGEIIDLIVSVHLKNTEKRMIEPLNLSFQLNICKTRQFHKTGYKVKLFIEQIKVNLEMCDLECIYKAVNDYEEDQIEYCENSEYSEKNLNPSFFQDLGDIMKTKILISINSIRIQLEKSENQLIFSLNSFKNIANLTKTKLLISNTTINDLNFTAIGNFQPISTNTIDKIDANLNIDLFNLISEHSLIIEKSQININPIFISVLINFYEDLKISKANENSSSEEQISNLKLSLNLLDCNVLIKSQEISSWDVTNLSFSSNFFYSSRKKSSFNEEMSGQISHFQVINSNSDFQRIIGKPMRISFSYEYSTEKSFLIKFEDLNLFLGFRDIDFFNTLQKTYSKIYYGILSNQRKSAENKITQQVILESFHVQFIEDTILSPYPLVFIKGNSLVFLSNSESLIVSGTFSCETFDKQLKIRQPFMRPWKFFTKAQKNEIIIVSEDELDFNLNSIIVENLGIINKKLFQTINDWGKIFTISPENSENLDYEIINKLGIDCIFWFNAQQKDKIHLKNGEKLRFSYAEVEHKHRIGLNRKIVPTPQMHIINLSIKNCSTVNDIQIQSNTDQIFKVSGKYGIQTIRKSIKITEKNKLIKLTSNTCIFNKTQKSLNIIYKGKVFHVFKKLFIPITWKIEDIYIQGLEPEKIEDKIIVEIKKHEYYACYKENFEHKGYIINSFILDAPNCFENLLPFDIVVYIDDRDELLISAGGKKTFYGIGLINCILGIQILLKDSIWYTNTFSLKHGDQSVKVVNDLNWYIKVTVRTDNCVDSKILIMSDFLVINNCLHDILIKKCLVPKNCIGFMEAPKSGKVRICLASLKNTEKSDKINLNTVGLTECLTLTEPDNSSIYLAMHLSQFSSLTKILRILPRFVIKNELNIILYIRQHNTKENSKFIKLFPGELIHYSLSSPNSVATIQVSCNLIDWSSGFYICNLDDFQIKFKLSASEIDSDTKNSPWYFPSQLNNFYYFARVIVYSQNQASINILIKNPVDPDFKIVNKTQFDLKIRQFKIKSDYYVLPRGQSTVWVFENYLKNIRRVQIKFQKHKEYFCIEEVIEKNRKIGPFLVKRYGCGNTRFLEIFEESSTSNKGSNFLNFTPESGKVFLIDLKSLYVSIFSETVQEKLGILFTGLNCKYKIISEENEFHSIFISKMNFILSNMQIDNMDFAIEDFPVIVKREENDPTTPFFQLKYKREYFLLPNQPPVNVFHNFEMQIQPFLLKINHEFFLTTFNLFHQIIKSFYYDSTKKPEEFQELINEYVMPNPPTENNKSYFKFIRIHACNLKLSFRKHQSSQILKSSSELLKVLSNKFLDFAKVTESPLSLKEVIIENSFQDRYSLFWGILQNYSKQCLFQFYRILGATEILGNPIGLVDKLGTGVFEFFSEPAKGLLQGPKPFINGISKGTKSLFGNIVSGGLGSVAGIAGSLYNIISEEHSGKNPVLQDLGLYDLKSGLKGISKPYKSYQNNGLRGLIPGVFKGIWGFSIAPVAAILHLSHTITHRLALEANDLIPKDPDLRVKIGKFVGFDRKINLDLENFEGFFNYFFKDIRGHKVKIVIELGHETIIICEKMMFIVVGMVVIKKIKLLRIEKVEVHMIEEQFFIYIGMAGSGFSIGCKDIAPLAKMYYALNGWC